MLHSYMYTWKLIDILGQTASSLLRLCLLLCKRNPQTAGFLDLKELNYIIFYEDIMLHFSLCMSVVHEASTFESLS